VPTTETIVEPAAPEPQLAGNPAPPPAPAPATSPTPEPVAAAAAAAELPGRVTPTGEWTVPNWVFTPVLKIAIPHCGFGFGQPGTDVPPQEPAIKATRTEMHGFDEPAPAKAEPARTEPVETAPADDAAAAPTLVEPEWHEPAPATPAAPPQAASPSNIVAPAASLPAEQPAAAKIAIPEPAQAPAIAEAAAEEPPASPQRAPRPLGAPSAAAFSTAVPATLGTPAEAVPTAGFVEAQPGTDQPGMDTSDLAELRDERPLARNRRLYRRVGIEAELEIDGIRAQLVDLSMDGFAGTAKWQYQSQAIVPVAIRMSIDGVDIGTELRARILYASELRTGGRFVDPTPSQMALLRYLVTWRGKTAGALGTANLLEAIAGMPERSPAPPASAPLLELPGRRPPWWQRLIGRFLGRRSSGAE